MMRTAFCILLLSLTVCIELHARKNNKLAIIEQPAFSDALSAQLARIDFKGTDIAAKQKKKKAPFSRFDILLVGSLLPTSYSY